MAEQENIEKVWLSFERKFNVAQYESLTVSFGATMEVQQGASHLDTAKVLYQQIGPFFGRVANRECKKATGE